MIKAFGCLNPIVLPLLRNTRGNYATRFGINLIWLIYPIVLFSCNQSGNSSSGVGTGDEYIFDPKFEKITEISWYYLSDKQEAETPDSMRSLFAPNTVGYIMQNGEFMFFNTPDKIQEIVSVFRVKATDEPTGFACENVLTDCLIFRLGDGTSFYVALSSDCRKLKASYRFKGFEYFGQHGEFEKLMTVKNRLIPQDRPG